MNLEKSIVVVKRADDYMAYQKGNKGVWGAGRNPYEAIGNCINTHREVFDITVIDETKLISIDDIQTRKFRVKKKKDIKRWLENNGYEKRGTGSYQKMQHLDFNEKMFEFCGKEIEVFIITNNDLKYRYISHNFFWNYNWLIEIRDNTSSVRDLLEGISPGPVYVSLYDCLIDLTADVIDEWQDVDIMKLDELEKADIEVYKKIKRYLRDACIPQLHEWFVLCKDKYYFMLVWD